MPARVSEKKKERRDILVKKSQEQQIFLQYNHYIATWMYQKSQTYNLEWREYIINLENIYLFQKKLSTDICILKKDGLEVVVCCNCLFEITGLLVNTMN